MEWDEIIVDGNCIDIGIKHIEDSQWLVYADEKLEGGEYHPYRKREESLDEAKELAKDLVDSPHPDDQSVTLGYVEITEVHRNE